MEFRKRKARAEAPARLLPRLPGGEAGRTADQAAGIAAMVWATAAVSFLP